jgi:hypothetical protein
MLLSLFDVSVSAVLINRWRKISFFSKLSAVSFVKWMKCKMDEYSIAWPFDIKFIIFFFLFYFLCYNLSKLNIKNHKTKNKDYSDWLLNCFVWVWNHLVCGIRGLKFSWPQEQRGTPCIAKRHDWFLKSVWDPVVVCVIWEYGPKGF